MTTTRLMRAAAIGCALFLAASSAEAGRRHSGESRALVAAINAKLKRWVHPTGHCLLGTRELLATYYDQGTRTASGERFHPDGLTVAMKSHAFGGRFRIVNPRNGRAVVVRHNDYGPATIADLDLSRGAFRALGLTTSSYVCVGDL